MRLKIETKYKIIQFFHYLVYSRMDGWIFVNPRKRFEPSNSSLFFSLSTVNKILPPGQFSIFVKKTNNFYLPSFITLNLGLRWQNQIIGLGLINFCWL